MVRCIGFHGWSFGLVVVLAACPAGDDETTNASADVSGDSGETSTEPTNASTTVSDTGTTTASTTSSMTEATSSTTTANPTTSETSETTGTIPGEPCGDFACEQTEYCDWALNDCGNPGLDPPTCTLTPDGCPGVEGDPVCGCDGIVYPDECTASLAGVDVDETSGCEPPGTLFPCGYKFCDPTAAYCQISTSDIGGFPDSYACVPLPESCGDAPVCGCLEEEPCFSFSCSERGGGMTILCPGG